MEEQQRPLILHSEIFTHTVMAVLLAQVQSKLQQKVSHPRLLHPSVGTEFQNSPQVDMHLQKQVTAELILLVLVRPIPVPLLTMTNKEHKYTCIHLSS